MTDTLCFIATLAVLACSCIGLYDTPSRCPLVLSGIWSMPDIPINYSLRDFGVAHVSIDVNLLGCCHNTSTQLPLCWLLLVCNVYGSVDVCTHQDAIFGFAIGRLRCACLRKGVLTCQWACIRSPPIQDALDV
jgi:hypothetical protein